LHIQQLCHATALTIKQEARFVTCSLQMHHCRCHTTAAKFLANAKQAAGQGAMSWCSVILPRPGIGFAGTGVHANWPSQYSIPDEVTAPVMDPDTGLTLNLRDSTLRS
jgi:hypothetical protein